MKTFCKFLMLFLFLTSCSNGEYKNNSYNYHTPEDIDIFLDEIKLNYPDITSLETVGCSQSGKYVIKALVISKNGETNEVKPAVRLTGGIHGNEKMGIEILIRFMEYLTSNYSKDRAVTELVNSKYICIIPVLNPDGLASSSRYNSRGVDLNRNFNDKDNHWLPGIRHGSEPFSESETKAMKNFSLKKNFNLSITYHVGAVLVNLPYDFAVKDDEIPEDYDQIKLYAKTYTKSGTFLSNPDIYKSPYMDEGTIRGGNWYVITGSLQDWSYTETKCLDLTIEVAKYNPDSEEDVERIFMYNRDSLMAYIACAGNYSFSGL